MVFALRMLKGKTPSAATQPAFLTSRWRNLAMLNYEIEPAILEPYLPTGAELDSYNGKTYVSVVGALYEGTRLMGIAAPFHRNFEEISLRFYVRREWAGEVKRGVVNIKKFAPKPVVSLMWKFFYNERYETIPTEHIHIQDDRLLSVSYEWEYEGDQHSIGMQAKGSPMRLQEDTVEEFIIDRNWGYVALKNGGALEYELDHPRWGVWEVRDAALISDVEQLYGSEFAPYITRLPSSALLAEGSHAIVRWCSLIA